GAGAVTEEQVQAESGEHLKQLLREDHRYIFTLIQKFHKKKGETYPMLSARKDIIVITDERLPLISYTKELFQSKCDLVYQHIYDSYFGQGQSIYCY
ncbi:MAG: hypothetical protein Q8O17_05905, partial [Candidatus Methanoperedens sp.]|nr:hypothetical protein [Candidatus Methanoperedens sp.]